MLDSESPLLGSRIIPLLCLLTLCLCPKLPVHAAGYRGNDGKYGPDLTQYDDETGASSSISGAGAASGRYDLCLTTETSDFLPPPYSNLSKSMPCMPIWNTFVLRYLQGDDGVMTVIVAAVYTTGWVGVGFSKDGKMVGSSAMVGWITKKGHAKIKQFYLQGTKRSQVVPDQGELQLQKVPPVVVLHGAMIYLAFQLKFEAKVGRQPVILAFSSSYPSEDGHLRVHDDKTTVEVDFSKGYVSAAASPCSVLRRNHGVLAIMAWAFLLPLGAIFARYLKHRDPLWYYLHVVVQLSGFVFGLAAVLLGLQLYNKSRANVPGHRGIGIFLLVLSILQVMAFFVRPKKEAKVRGYWNWFHHWAGRIALFFGNLNIILGIILADSGIGWRAGYGILSTLVIVSVIVLEFFRIRSSKKASSSPASQMNTL